MQQPASQQPAQQHAHSTFVPITTQHYVHAPQPQPAPPQPQPHVGQPPHQQHQHHLALRGFGPPHGQHPQHVGVAPHMQQPHAAHVMQQPQHTHPHPHSHPPGPAPYQQQHHPQQQPQLQQQISVEQLVALVAQDPAFARAVAGQDAQTAAIAALTVFKTRYKVFSSFLNPRGKHAQHAQQAALAAQQAAAAQQQAHAQQQQQLAQHGGFAGGGPAPHLHGMVPVAPGLHGAAGAGPADSGSPVVRSEQRGGSGAPGRGGEAGAALRGDLRRGDRVLINVNHKKHEGTLIGKEGVVLSVTSNGWVRVQVGAEALDLQLRNVTPLHGRSAGPSGAGGLAQTPSLTLKGSRTAPRKSDVMKGVRKELSAVEERVPWKEVADRWRTARKNWTRKLRQADATRDMALCMREFLDCLRFGKSLAGGTWEAALRECIAGAGNHLQLQTAWDELRGKLQAWLAASEQSSSIAHLDRSCYEAAIAIYKVLQRAVEQGDEFLGQVPLEQVLTSQKEFLALQHIIQREAAEAHNALQQLAAAATGDAPPRIHINDIELEGGVTGDMLLQLHQVPRVLASVLGGCPPGFASGHDTDKEAGSEATDVDEMDLA